MKIFSYFRRMRLIALLTVVPMVGLFAANESYVQSLSGHLKKGDSLTVIDDKFLNLPLEQWNQLRHLAVDNIVTFALRRDTASAYNSRSFTCTLNVTIKYYTSRDQQTPKEIDSVNLVVRYDTTRGKPFADLVKYRFKNAFKVTVIINSISSPEWKDKLPDVFRLTSQIMVDRRYPVDPNAKGKIHLGAFIYNGTDGVIAASGPVADATPEPAIKPTSTDGQVTISWLPADFSNPPAYDLEWTYVDAQSDLGGAILNSYGGSSGTINIPPDIEAQWMLHDATRATVASPLYTINVPYQDGYVLIRIRGVWTEDNGLSRTGDWAYDADDGTSAVVSVPAFQTALNWQYTANFAEEGKRKEIITYFDATQRSRQTVTINNSAEWIHPDIYKTRTPVAVVQETVYDVMGRPAVNVLPAPVKNSLLNFYPSFNKNSATNTAYRSLDIALDNLNGNGLSCAISAPPMSTGSGASQYYSAANTFLDNDNLGLYPFNPYIPDAEGYPFTLTEYTPDNTGRIRRQGGVGQTLQVGQGHETNYFYGKPTASQLQRMFGMEVGNPSHYLKNMVVDPNGQASVSYIDASGKTIATALAGSPPNNLSNLPSSDANVANRRFNDVLIRPMDFTVDAGNLSMSATATFLAETTDAMTVHYSVNPLALVTTYNGNSQLCNNCYYTLTVTAKNDCGEVLNSATSQPFQGADYTCHADAAPIVKDLPLTTGVRPGEISVTYSLQLSNDVINAQTDYYVQNNSDLKKLQTFFEQELAALDVKGCYSTCSACKLLPKSVDDFTALVKKMLAKPDFANVVFSDPIQSWINSTYTALKIQCTQLSCAPESPCDQKLDQLKQDVLPGGQYAPYNADDLANGASTVFSEPQINVMVQYNQDPTISALTFTASDGTTQTVGSLSQADFVRAYLLNPSWADYFVKYHVEYCSYLWCKDGSNTNLADNNEVSYTFDANLQQNYTNGADAVAAGYYNHGDPLALLSKDPWFNGGRGSSLLSNMQSDLQNLSTVMKIAPVDAGNNPLPGKNIIQFVDWALYCKPTDPSTPVSQVAVSWGNCAPADNCRSVSMEWQMYLNYYLQLKSKYYRIAKAAYFAATPFTIPGTNFNVNANCLDCFIGKDPLYDVNGLGACAVSAAANSGGSGGTGSGGPVTCPVANSDYLIVKDPATCDGCTYESNYYSYTAHLIYNNVANKAPVTVIVYTEIDGLNDLGMEAPISSGYFNTYTISPGDDIILGEGHVNFDILDDGSGKYRDYNGLSYFFESNESVCNPPPPPPPPPPAIPASSCTSNPNYQLYKDKSRVFDDYVDWQDYTACASSNSPTTSQAAGILLQQATNDLVTREGSWLSRLQTIRDAEFSSVAGELTDATLNSLVSDLYQISAAYLQYAAQNKLSMNVVSTLPAGVTASNGYTTFDQVFQAHIPLDARNKGFTADLLDNVYPYDKVPSITEPNITRLTPDIYDNVKNNLAAFQSAWNGQGKFGDYLANLLGDDYQLTDDELSDLQARLAGGCPNPYLANPVIMPLPFVLPNPGGSVTPPTAYVTCSKLTELMGDFSSAYPGVPADGQLYQLLLTNYLNHQLGYALSYADYASPNCAILGAGAVAVYAKPQTPSITEDPFSCVASQMLGTYYKGGQDYDIYITQVRIAFRNAYISKCLSNQASANMDAQQYEYHYTLYYYDQSGNLVKTVPPEGVHLLSDADVAKLASLPAQDPSACPVFPSTVELNQTRLLTALSGQLQTNTALSMELWLHADPGSSAKQVRMVTPDNKYMVQAAIANGNVWFEVYTLNPDGTTGIEMDLTNEALASLPPQLTLQPWTHLMIVSSTGLAGGALTLYVDGTRLTNLADVTAPSYPFPWEIDGSSSGFVLPTTDISQAASLRLYNIPAQDADVVLNYQSACMTPQGNLSSFLTLTEWGLFNPPSICNNYLNTTALPVANQGSLAISSNPDPSGTLARNGINSVNNTFTVEFWVKPNGGVLDNIEDLSEQYSGIDDAPPYAIFPQYGGTADHANMGVAVGTNGITVFEHTTSYLPAVLDWRGSLTGWTHVAVVYNNRIPSLYINGVLQTAGFISHDNSPSTVSPSYNFGGSTYGYMPGGIDEVRIWNVARTGDQIKTSYQKSLDPSDVQGLIGYWPMDNTDGNNLQDVSCGGLAPANFLSPAMSWATTGADVAEVKHVPFAGQFIVPNHGLPTYYVNNSLNQVVQQTTPDAGASTFVYDRLGRLIISQNAEQKQPATVDVDNPAGRFSYTKYDNLGRITEVGEKLNASALDQQSALDETAVTGWMASGTNRQATVTIYDNKPDWAPADLGIGFPRKRVAATALLSEGSDPANSATRTAATYYRYDLDGNVAEVMQENTQLMANEQQFVTGSTGIKDIKYEYDLLSGKVNKVLYQDGKWDQFYYQYEYDSSNRLVGVYTDRYNDLTPEQWTKEASYQYYLHGPMARMELGEQRVQGLDYAYTLQGWVKGVNGQTLFEKGHTQPSGMLYDGQPGPGFTLNPVQPVGLDAMGYSLGYFANDYKPIGGTSALAFASKFQGTTPAGQSLYNGNISNSTYALFNMQFHGQPQPFMGYAYRYDQLNRLTMMDAHNGNGGDWGSGDLVSDYGERISYDANGNIQTYTRNGTAPTGAAPMDNLTYNYNRNLSGNLVNNRLRHINDNVDPNLYSQDIDDQPVDNYSYDNIGNLKADQAGQINKINWTVYGKMASISKSAVEGLKFGYDAGGHRINKTATAANGTSVQSHYVLDPQGNVLAVYQYKGASGGTLTEGDWVEQHLYGSSRLGILQPHMSIPAGQPISGNYGYDGSQNGQNRTTDPVETPGNRVYELTNHLGNVMTTVNDINTAGSIFDLDELFSVNQPTIMSQQDYYPFGMQMPGRSYIVGGSLNYRYGFNGKEKDDEVKGVGNQIDYGMRVYDPRIGKFLSVDPLTKPYPYLTPYQFASNKPIDGADLDGKEWALRTVSDNLHAIPQIRYDDIIRRAGTIKPWDGQPNFWGKVKQGIGQMEQTNPGAAAGLSMLYGVIDDAHVTYTNIERGRGYATHLDNSSVSSYKELITSGVNTTSLIFGGLQSSTETAVLGRLSIGMQGEWGEHAFGGNLNLFSKNFRTFDNFTDGIATSAKTLDLGAPTYLNRPASITTKLNGYIDKIAGFTQARGGDFRLTSSMIDTRELGVLTIGRPNGAQFSALQLSQQYAESKGIQFTLKSTPLSDPLIKGLLASPRPTTTQSQSQQQ